MTLLLSRLIPFIPPHYSYAPSDPTVYYHFKNVVTFAGKYDNQQSTKWMKDFIMLL